MVGKLIKIGVLVVLAVVSFGVSFIISGKMKPQATEQTATETNQAEPERFDMEKELLGGLAAMETADLNPKEKQLDELIRDVRAKLKQIERQERDLAEREERLNMATENLKKQSEDIGKLRIELLAAITPLKAAKEDLLRFRALIKTEEVANLQSAAKMYAQMEPANAARIILEMYNSKQEQQAAKIIHFLPENTWAEIMNEIKDSGKAAEIINRQLQVITKDGKS